MTNRQSRYCFGIALAICIASTAFATPQSPEQIAMACKPYLERYDENQGNLSQAALNTLQQCSLNSSCQTDALSSISDCSRKLNILLAQAPAPVPIPILDPYAPKPIPKKPLPAWEAAIEHQKTEAEPTTPPPQPQPPIQSNEDDATVSTPPAQTPPPSTPTQNNNKKSTPSINWF